jgi:TonB-dependent SusC/RagA subfamily outer membrane receptor
MKNILITTRIKTVLLVLVGILFLTNCKSTQTVPGEDASENVRQVDTTPGLVSILDLIQRAPGVTVRGTTVRVFGPNSFLNTSDPLFLVNGSVYSGGLPGILGSINPTDVQSIEVYKSPSELAIYGARGANGVINIILNNR